VALRIFNSHDGPVDHPKRVSRSLDPRMRPQPLSEAMADCSFSDHVETDTTIG
jgi:hypothetical protein